VKLKNFEIMGIQPVKSVEGWIESVELGISYDHVQKQRFDWSYVLLIPRIEIRAY
jgi:hypothetical protein